MRILLIEDDEALCRVLQPSLQAAGFASDCCHSGADGLALLKTGCYDACILDRMLPELDGLQLLHQARSAGVTAPVLMLPALGRVGDRVDGLDAGADDYLTKPFDTRELLARLRALVRRPPLIFADEPTGALDSASATELLEALASVRRSTGSNILMVTHDPYAASYTDRILYFKDGHITAQLQKEGDSRQAFYRRITKQAEKMDEGR